MGVRSRQRKRPAGRAGAQGAAATAAGAPEASTRERILLAALQVFAEQGFDGARTRDIAERADANLGLIQYYFEGKEQLWRAAVSRAFEDLQAELGGEIAVPGDGAPDGDRVRLARVLRHFVRFVARRPEFMRLMNDEGKRHGPRMRWLADHHVRPMADALRDLALRAQAGGALPAEVPVASLHYIALGAAGLLFSQAPECAYLLGVDPTAESFAEAHADAVVRLLLGPEPARVAS
jgi:AcrR family transcriptional regulator